MGQRDDVGDVTGEQGAAGGRPVADRTVLVAPAKLTVSLRVLGRRPDGYHEIEAEMVSLDLADQLELDPAGDGLEVVAPDGPTGWTADAGGRAGDGPSTAGLLELGEGNLVSRALAAVGRRAHVRLYKRVPVGGGLGGGSSDAAAVLRWAGCDDLDVAARLGADVPFCVRGGRALVSGIGEKVVPLDHVARAFVLLLPPFGVNTAAVYRGWDHLVGARGDGVDRLAAGPGGAGQPAHGRVNDLTVPALAVEPRLARWRDLLGEATGREPVLAGSGSTWWVEGTPSELGLDGQAALTLEGEEGRLLAVRTVPAGWAGDGRPGEG